MPAFYDAAAEVTSLLSVFQEAVVRGTVRPLDAGMNAQGRSLSLGLTEDAVWYLLLTRANDSGVLWVQVCDMRGDPLSSWSEHELDSTRVRALWTACREQLYAPKLETALAGLSTWLKDHR